MRDRLQIVTYVTQYPMFVGVRCKIKEFLFAFALPVEREIALQTVNNEQGGLDSVRGILIEIVGIANASAVTQHRHKYFHAAG